MTNPQPSKEGARGVDACVLAKLLHLCLTFLQPFGLQPARLLSPWDCPGSNTEVGCHFLLQGSLPNPGIEPTSFTSPALAVRFFTTRVIWEAQGSRNLEPNVHRVRLSTSRTGWRVHLQAQIENCQKKLLLSPVLLCIHNKENNQKDKLLKVLLEPHNQHPQWLIVSPSLILCANKSTGQDAVFLRRVPHCCHCTQATDTFCIRLMLGL